MTRPALFSSRAACNAFGVAVLALVALAAAMHAKPKFKKIPALEPDTVMWPGDTFRAGADCADKSDLPAGLRSVGSWVGGDGFTGTFVSGWFAARPRVTLFISGFPHKPGCRLALETRDAAGRITALEFAGLEPRELWQPWTVALPAEATAFRVRAVDGFTGFTGWLGVTEPFERQLHFSWLSLPTRTLLAFGVQALLFIALGAAAIVVLPSGENSGIDARLVPLLGAAAVAAVGYVAFWIYFAHPLAGRIFSWSVCGLAGVALVWRARRNIPDARRAWLAPVGLAVLVGALYLALLLCYDASRFSFATANRFVESLPSDNDIPRGFAQRLWQGDSPRHFWGEWLSSDRPPLQSGWVLLTWPVLRGLGLDSDTSAGVGGLCFQLLWIPAVWALAGRFGLSARRSLALAAAISFSGVGLMYTVFVWPKFAAAAFGVAAYLLWFDDPATATRRRFAVGGLCAVLGWLAHGGVVFSLLAIAPLAWLRHRGALVARWWPAAVAFVLLAAPWIAYQRFYDPPGNRLLKWHLAGAPDLDPRPFGQTLRESYEHVGWAGALRNRWANVSYQFAGRWDLWPWHEATRNELRRAEMLLTVRALDAWLFALPVWAVFAIKRRRDISGANHEAGWAALWLALGLAVWIALMFSPGSASVHQGTLVTQLLAFALLAWCALTTSRWFFVALATVQALWFALVWAPPSGVIGGSLQPFAAAAAAITGLVVLSIAWRSSAPCSS